MSFSTIIVLGRYQSTSGPARGTVTFTRSALLRDSSTGELLLPYPVVAHLDSEGILRIALAANNDPTTLPTGTTYTVQEAAGDCTRTYSITVPYDTPNGILDLVSVAHGTLPGTVSLSAVTGGSGGAGGALTPTTVTIGTPGDNLGWLTVAGDVADTISAAVFGSDAPTYGQAAVEAHTGTGFALFGQASGANGTAVYGVATGTGSFGGTFQNDSGTGVSSQVTTGEAAYFLASNPAGVALHVSGAMLQGDGPIILLPQAEPATPPSSGAALYQDIADGKVKIKDASGTVHALW